jgi:DNA-binding response OmpR family regulator
LQEGRDKKVLVIEDSAISRQLIRETLEREGFCVLEAGSAEKGLRLAAQERPRLFLIDLYLPGLDGLEAVGMIRSLEGMDQVPIVMMSAAVSNEERERVMRADCDHYLRKPIDMVELPLLLSRLIEGGRGRAPEEEAGDGHIELKLPGESLEDPEERMLAIEKVRAALNHDLRTPLTVIISYAHTVAQGKVGPLSDKQREMLELVVEQGFQMDAMIVQLVSMMQRIKDAEEGPA